MASRQDVRSKEEKAEKAARAAADELRDVNRQGQVGSETVVVERHEQIQTDEGRPGSGEAAERERKIVEETKEKAREYNDYAAEKGREGRPSIQTESIWTMQHKGQGKPRLQHRRRPESIEIMRRKRERKLQTRVESTRTYTAQKTKEPADVMTDKAKEAKYTTMGKIGEYKDYAAQKTKEAAAYTADKAKQAKDYTVDKAAAAKDYTVDKTATTRDYTAKKAKNTKNTTVEN